MENDVAAGGSLATKETSVETLNLESLGMALAIAWFGIMLWSPNVIPVYFIENHLDLHMHVLRLLLLGTLCVVYLLVQFFPFIVHNRTIKFVAVGIAVMISPFSLLGNVVPAFAEIGMRFPAIVIVSWMGVGFSAAVMMLIWGYDMSTKVDHRQGVVNIASSLIFFGAFFVLNAFLQKEASSVLIMIIPFAMLAAWIVCLRDKNRDSGRKPAFEEVTHPTALTNVRQALGKSTTVFISSYGFIMGIAGAIGTQFGVMEYSFIYVGLSSIAAGIVMCVVLRTKRLKISKKTFMLFLPFAVMCLFLLSVASDGGKIVILFMIYFVVNSYNVINTAYMGKEKDERRATYDLFSCESRTADMIGSAIGWGFGTSLQFILAPSLEPYGYFLVAAGLVGVTIVSLSRHDEEREQQSDSRTVVRSVMTEWEETCARLAEHYRLSARENEVFLLLSRGRDRQYIHTLLYISPSTVRTHTYNIYQKMGVHSQQQLIDAVESELLKK